MTRIKRLPGVTTGRPPQILQPEVRKRLVQGIRDGNWQTVAARAAGIHESSFRHWMNEGRDASVKAERGETLTERETFFLAFLQEIEAAEADAEAAIVLNLRALTLSHPSAALGMLAVRFPDRWREKKQVEVSGPEGGPIQLSPVLAQIPDDELEARIRVLEAEVGKEKT